MSDDEKPEPTHDMLVEATMKLLLQEGIIERVETRLRTNSQMSSDEIEDLVGEAQMKLIANAPPPLRSSFEIVCQWHRWNAIYKNAEKTGSVSVMMDALKHMDRLMGSVH
jgi:hypothetical protein